MALFPPSIFPLSSFISPTRHPFQERRISSSQTSSGLPSSPNLGISASGVAVLAAIAMRWALQSMAPLKDSSGGRQPPHHTNTQSTTADASPFQDLAGHRISLDKLSEKLQSKYGAGAYEIYLMHDVYSVKAPGRLSVVSANRSLPHPLSRMELMARDA